MHNRHQISTQSGCSKTPTRSRIGAQIRSSVIAVAALITFARVAEAQTADTACHVSLRGSDFVGAPVDLARLVDLTDSTTRASFMIQRVGQQYRTAACRAPSAVAALASQLGSVPSPAWAQVLPVNLFAIGNSAYPRDWNDGALWGGRGTNVSLTAGAEFSWGPFRAALAPVLTWQQNSDFDIRDPGGQAFSRYGHPFWGYMIDAPQRFGTESYSRAYIGQSFARIEIAGLAAGLSNENLRWGAVRRNPLLLSGTAPGFAHVFFETESALDVWVGGLEFQFFWGRLEESDYFDTNPDNNHRILAGAIAVLQPYVLEGLYLGGGRMHARTWFDRLSTEDVLLGPYRNVRENVQSALGDNQMISLMFRWATAPQGFEVYGEWGREDHWDTATGLLKALDASQAYTLGFQKLVRRGSNALRIAAEISHLADALPIRNSVRGVIPWYTNTAVVHGHTNRGQLLGAPIGTGAETQYLGADYFWYGGRTSFSVERTRYDNDAYHVYYAPVFGAHARDTELSLRTGHLATFDALSIDAEVGWSLRYNRTFLGLDDLDETRRYRRADNWSLRLATRWLPRLAF